MEVTMANNNAVSNTFQQRPVMATSSPDVLILKESQLEEFAKKEQIYLSYTRDYKAGSIITPSYDTGWGGVIVAIVPDEPQLYDLAFLESATTLDENATFNLFFYSNTKGKTRKHKEAGFSNDEVKNLLIGYGLANHRYQDSFSKHPIKKNMNSIAKKSSLKPKGPKILIPSSLKKETKEIISTVEAIALIRDLINTPAEHITPESLIGVGESLAKEFNARSINTYFKSKRGDKLDNQELKGITIGQDFEKDFPAVYAVGKSSENQPAVIDFKWGDWDNEDLPKITLVGKGVTFDTGGLNLKGASMKDMKGDMGGAAHALGLARIVMGMDMPVRLRVIIPSAENGIGPEAMRPSDVIHTRKGKSVEVTNTDAEGRLILADALALASEDNPDLIINYATLTGAAIAAYGYGTSALFAADTELGRELEDIGFDITGDKMQHTRYDETIANAMRSSDVADLVNSNAGARAGAIQAGCFLREFVSDPKKFVHIDTYASNNSPKAGEPSGGADRGLRTVLHYLKKRYANKP